jgi:hypothetical protein
MLQEPRDCVLHNAMEYKRELLIVCSPLGTDTLMCLISELMLKV